MNRILVVDDHTLIRKGIQNILRPWPEWEFCGEAANGEEAVRLTQYLQPDIVLMDISMPVMDGLRATRAIRKVSPETKVLLLTLHDSIEWMQYALQSGAKGYVLKSDSEAELLRALETVARNQVYVSPGLDADRLKRVILESGEVI